MFKWLEKNLPKIVLAPAVGLISWFVMALFFGHFTFHLQIQKFFQNTNYGVWANMQNYGLRENGLLQ